VIELADGARLRAESLRLEAGRLIARGGPTTWRIDLARLAGIQIGSDAYAYLSDLEPIAIEARPLLDVAWEPRLDSAAAGGPLTLDGRQYAHGIGMHTRTAMAFELTREFTHFYATAGVDDAAGGLGSVVFRVTAGGRTVIETPPLTGRDRAVQLCASIAGARRLTLVADFGSDVEAAGNLADWAEARVVRMPPERGPTPPTGPGTGS
jgi:hypothetical protein